MVKVVIAVLLGAVVGAAIGTTRTCKEGTCPLTANPKRGALWGGFLGLAVALSLGGVLPAESAANQPPSITEIASEDQFTSLTQPAGKTALAVFHATWCMPCRFYAGTVRKAAASLGPEVPIARVDIDKFPNLAKQFEVKVVPTTVILRDGKEVHRLTGMARAKTLIQEVQKNLPRTNELQNP